MFRLTFGGSEGQNMIYGGLLLPTFFSEKRGVRLFGVCVFNWRTMVCKEWPSDTHYILTLFTGEISLNI